MLRSRTTRICAVMFCGRLPRGLPPNLDAVKSLCQFEPFTFSKALVSFFEKVAPFAGKVAYLAVVTAQGGYLYVIGVGNVAEVIRFFGTPEQDFFNFVRLEPLFNQVGISQSISGIRENSVQHHLPGDAVVAVPDITSVRVGGSHNVRSIESD